MVILCEKKFGRLERLEHLAKKLKHKCEIHEAWADGKEDMLRGQEYKRCRLNELKVSLFTLA